MKELLKNKKVTFLAVLFGVLAITATLLLITGCSNKSLLKDTEKHSVDFDRAEYSTYGIGYVVNEDDPLYAKAESVNKFSDKEVFIHKFDSRNDVKTLLRECGQSSNYYVQKIANSIYRYDDSFFEDNSVFLAFIRSNGKGVRFSLSGLETEGNYLCLKMNEYVLESYYNSKSCWVISFSVEKSVAKKCKNYDVTFESEDFAQGNAPDYSQLKDVELDFDVKVDYTASSPEFKLNSVYTGLSFNKEIRDSSLNSNAFVDNTQVNLAVHTFDSKEELIAFWGRFDYPEERKDGVEKFLDGYGDEFFKEHTLVTLYADQYGSDTEYSVDSVRTQATTIVINVSRTKKGVAYTSGADAQILALEMERTAVENCFYYTAIITDAVGGDRETPPNITELFEVKNTAKAGDNVYEKALNADRLDKKTDEFEPLQLIRQVPLHKVESKAELQELFGEYSVTSDGKNWTKKYDDYFFGKNNLFIVFLRTYSGKADYEVNSLNIYDDSFSITFKKTKADDKSSGRVLIATVVLEKKYGRAKTGMASVYDEDPPRAIETQWASITETNVYIDKYISSGLTKIIDRNSDMFTKALNADVLANTDAVHIPFHFFRTYDEYNAIVGQYIKGDIYYSDHEFAYKDVFLLYIDNTMIENGYYELTRDFVVGNSCTMALLEYNGGARIQLSDSSPAWIIMFYCDKGYYDDITEFDAIVSNSLDELLELVS